MLLNVSEASSELGIEVIEGLADGLLAVLGVEELHRCQGIPVQKGERARERERDDDDSKKNKLIKCYR